jgi:hypothetical protein
MRYNNEAEYLNPEGRGVPVSAKFDTWEEAEKVRDILREGEPRFYYNIVHTTSVAVIDREVEGGDWSRLGWDVQDQGREASGEGRREVKKG